jgi:hypothetical protein
LLKHATSLGLTILFKKQVRMNTQIAADITEALASHMNAKGLAFVEATENDLYSSEPELGTPVVNGEPRWLIMHHKQTGRNVEHYPPLHLIPERTSQVTYHRMRKYLSKFPTCMIHSEEYNVMFIRKFFFLPLFTCVEIDNFIVPAKDLIVGPFKRRGQHVCLTDRLWHRHATPLLDEGRNQNNVQCSHHCDQGEHPLEQVLYAAQTRI